MQMEEALKQEEILQFSRFTSNMALEIGLALVNKAKVAGKCITVDISRNGHRLFHFAMEGTSPDNEAWTARKRSTVNRFGRSSLYIGLKLKKEGRSMEEKYGISPFEYSAHGGGFPLRLRDTGAIGAVCVSGMSQAEDHDYIVDVLSAYLKNNMEEVKK